VTEVTQPSGVAVSWLGRVAYEEASRLQQEIVSTDPWGGDRLLLLEHDPVFTTGRGGNPANRPSPTGPFGQVPLHRVGRGGDATFHGPGQLVGYALVDLRARGGDLHRFLRALERGVIDLLAGTGVSGHRVPGRTGVWVGGGPDDGPPRKIASIGIGVRRGRTMHGFALNASVDLGAFAAIVPCGIEGVVTTSLAAEGVCPVPTVEDLARLAAQMVPRALDREVDPAAFPWAGEAS